MGEKNLTPLGILVKDALKKKNMTQVELAKRLGTSKQYLYLILCGYRSGSKYLEKIYEICDISLRKYSNDNKKAI